MSFILDITIILILILANGLLAMAEFAIVSAKKIRLRQRAEQGDRGAEEALHLAHEPTKFLSTIQIGITVVGIFAGAFGGITIAKGFSEYLSGFPLLSPYSEILGVAVVVLIITYFTLVFGELVPKQIALNNAETIASVIAKPMTILSRIASPLVYLLSSSTSAILRLFGIISGPEEPVTEEEIKFMIEEGADAGTIEKSEQSMVERVFDMGDRRVSSLMTPRPDIVAIDIEDPLETALDTMSKSSRSVFPVYRHDLDTILGVVQVKDLWSVMAQGKKPDLPALIKKALCVPTNLKVLQLLELFKTSGTHFALVSDEYGSIKGLVTLYDILESIVGDVHSLGEPAEVPAVKREDGSWLIDGRMPIEDFKEIFPGGRLPWENAGYYQTVAGFILMRLQRIPSAGDHFTWRGLRFEVVDMDGKRVDKVLVTGVPE